MSTTTKCFFVHVLLFFAGTFTTNAQWTLTGSGATGLLSTPGSITVAKETYTAGWFRNSVAGTGLYNSATTTGIYSPSSGMVATYNNGSFTANEIYANGWFRNTAVNEGLFNSATGTGIYSTGAGMMTIYNNGSFTANEIYANGWFRNNNINEGLFNTATGTGIYSTGAGMMAIYNNGNLTIGNAPYRAGYKLFVDQGILTEKVKVAVAGSAQWADHVFHQNYKLMPLEQVEQFIQQNKHLPNIPSAAEMVKEGNDLGKTDAKLLEKIEELTLYLIEIKKEHERQNAAQQKEIETLKIQLQQIKK